MDIETYKTNLINNFIAKTPGDPHDVANNESRWTLSGIISEIENADKFPGFGSPDYYKGYSKEVKLNEL